MSMSELRPLLFGSFDGLHPGHDALLRQAHEALGVKVTVCLALDEDIARRKGRAPKHAYAERERQLRDHALVADVLPGDAIDGTYSAVTSLKPTHIFFGYDQGGLQDHLRKWLDEHKLAVELITLQPFEADLYKSSIVNKRTP